MKNKKLFIGVFIASIFAAIFGGRAFATAGNTAEISGGKTWNICVEAGAGYDEADFVVDIAKSDFESQLMLDGGDCKAVALAAGAYAVRLNNVMGAGAVSYEAADSTLTFTVADALRNYLNIRGSISYTIEGSGEESPFELLFSMPGECQFNGNANVSGETCKDSDGNPLTNKKYIDTGVALFSSENAAKDFEIYFTLTDYASTQPQNQATLFNAKYENSSMYYPGFTLRTLSNNGDTLELTGRFGKDNTDADKANIKISGTSIKGKEVKIVRVGGMVSYSIDGGELIPFQNYKNFNRYFEQTAVFGASMQTNGNPQRYFDGTITDIRVYLKKVGSIEFDANGGTGTMSAIRDVAVGTNVVLPTNTFTRQGASFGGWNTEVDGTGIAYADGETIPVATTATIRLYAQWVGKAVLDDGVAVNLKLKKMAGTYVSDYDEHDNNIKAIKEADSLPVGFDNSNTDYIISADTSLKNIYAWFDDSDLNNDGEGDGVIYLYTDANVIEGGESIGFMFNSFVALSNISALASWDTSNVKYMGSVFLGDDSLSDISALASWDTSSVEDISEMFRGTMIVNTDALETKRHAGKSYVSWDTSNVSRMAYAFSDVVSLSDISALASWDTSNVKDMGNMFGFALSLSDISALASWNTSNVTNMTWMFYDTEITNVDALRTERHIGKDYVSWDVSKVENMGGMFHLVDSLSDISALASWDTSSVTNISGMFDGGTVGSSLSDISALASWNTSNVKYMNRMFSVTKIADIDALANWDTSKVVGMSDMFSCTLIADLGALANWDTSKVIDMSGMFSGTLIADLGALANWNTSSVTDMSRMFTSVKITNVDALRTEQHVGKDYVSWDVSKVKKMGEMFAGATLLSDVSALSSWNTSSVTNMRDMFTNVPATPLPSWYHE